MRGGGYIYVKRDGSKITIKQDPIGCYGIHLYRNEDYFALSNSFLYLIDRIKTKRKLITFNKEFSYYLIAADNTHSETMINEITLMDRSAVIELDIPKKAISWYCIDYKENTVDLDSTEGIQILDGWYRKWTGIVKSLVDSGEDVVFDLSGGFDSRMAFLLAQGSGADLNKIYFASSNDGLYTHTEDYEIASMIAEHFGFTLNNAGNLSNDADYYSTEDILNMCWHMQGCFHKENYFHHRHFKKSRYWFTGFGGETLRAYLNSENEKAFIEGLCNSSLSYHFKDILQLYESIERVMERTFNGINAKLSDFRRFPVAFNNYLTILYREARCRSHFGRMMSANYYSNIFTLSPLLDVDLQKLKLCVSQDKNDRNALCALLFERYCPKLLDFKFDNNRKFSETTIQNIRVVNKQFPYIKKPVEIHVKTDIRPVRMNEIENVPGAVPEKLLKDAFYSDDVKNIILENYGTGVYRYISEDSKKRKYFPLTNIFPFLCICKIIKDASSPDILSPADFITDCASAHTENEGEAVSALSLCDHELLDFFITARVDIKNTGSDSNSIKFTEISDVTMIVSPDFLNKNGNGYVIHSKTGSLRIAFRCVQSGTLNVWLRAMYVCYADNSVIPVQIDYKKLAVDGEVIFDTIHTISHDKPFEYSKKVSDGKTVIIEAEWIPYDIRKERNPICEQQELIQSLRNANNDLKKSTSWKVGRLVTWLPRKIKAALFYKKH